MIQTREINDVAVLTIPESLDSLNADNLTQILSDLIEKEINFIVVDLSDTEFINSSGLNALVGKLPFIKSNGGDIRLALNNVLIKNQLRVTTLDQVFQCHDTVDAAVSSFS